MRLPFKLGPYHLIHQIGEGGFAEIYLALRDAKPFAVKILKENRTKDAALVSSFVREAKIALALQHPNILGFKDEGKIENFYFGAMELAVGVTLDQILKSQPPGTFLPTRFVLYVIHEVARALEYLHHTTVFKHSDEFVFHGDISPGNILITEDGRVLLIDFGSAGQSTITNPTQNHLGKLYYLPTEIFERKPYTLATDVYSLAAVSFYLLFGVRPFDAASQLDLIGEIRKGILPRPSAQHLVRSIREEGPLRIFFNQALHKDLSFRFSTIEAFEKAFQALHFSADRPRTVAEFQSTIPAHVKERLSELATSWQQHLKNYRATDQDEIRSTPTSTPVESMLAQIDQRKHPRLSVEELKLKADIVALEEKVKVQAPIMELSQGGMLVKWEGLPPRVGQDYPISFSLASPGGQIRTRGRLIYEVFRQAKPFVGFQFSGLNELDQAALKAFVHGKLRPDTSEASPTSEPILDVVFRSADDLRDEYGHNIQHGGIFVQSDKTYEPDSIVILRLHVEGQLEKLTLKGRVVYSKAIAAPTKGTAKIGVGLQLMNSADELKRLFSKFIAATN